MVQVGSPSSLASSVLFWPGIPHHGSGSVSFHKSGDLLNNRAEKISGVLNEILTYEFAYIVCNKLRFNNFLLLFMIKLMGSEQPQN